MTDIAANASLSALHGSTTAATYDRILAVAMDLFIARGHDGTTMSQVASGAGITTPALYWHFKSKKDLYFTVVREGHVLFVDVLQARSIGATVEDRFRRCIRAFVKMQLRDPTVTYGYDQLFSALPGSKRAEIEAIQETTQRLLTEILAQGREEGVFHFGDLDVTLGALMTMCEYVFTWYRPDGRLTVAEVAELYVRLARRLVGAD
jgi:AcrR family transcriptional regulator